MHWLKTHQEVYSKTGLKEPVFLWGDMGKKRLFIDVPTGFGVDIFYSYDPIKNKGLKKQHKEWHLYEAGRIFSDFAFEMLGVTAVRLKVHKNNQFISDSAVQLEIYQQNVEENNDR